MGQDAAFFQVGRLDAPGFPETVPLGVIWKETPSSLTPHRAPAAGTGAMKSGFTRTGKRTWGGVVDDGVKAVVGLEAGGGGGA